MSVRRAEKEIRNLDRNIIHFLRKVTVPFGRGVLFIVFTWFGALKVFGVSPADAIVADLLMVTMPGVSFSAFFIVLGIIEIIIGFLFLIPHAERIAIGFLLFHMLTTFMPLVLIPEHVWNGFLVLTLEGQYIVKNLVIVAVALATAAHLHPLKRHWLKH